MESILNEEWRWHDVGHNRAAVVTENGYVVTGPTYTDIAKHIVEIHNKELANGAKF